MEVKKSEKDFSKQLSHYLLTDQFNVAKNLLETRLKKSPDDKFLLTNYAIVLYEQRSYKQALRVSLKAMKIDDQDPLVLNNHAAILKMNDQTNSAIKIWKYLLNRKLTLLAFHDCQEGIRWTKSLLNDIRYNIAVAYADKNDTYQAKRYLRLHLRYRKKGQFSRYAKKEVRARLHTLDQ